MSTLADDVATKRKSNVPLEKRKLFTRKTVPLYLMILPVLILTLLFKYVPMWGRLIAFMDWRISGPAPQPWVGLANFRYMFKLDYFWQAFRNQWVFIGLGYLFGFPAPIIFALLLNELRARSFKRIIQTMTVLPNFLNWVVIGGIFIKILSPTFGYVNDIIRFFGGESFYFLSKPRLFPFLYTGLSMWKSVGYSAIIYLATLAGIDPELYESAVIDGAGRIKQTWHITLPGIKLTVVVLFVLSFANVMGGLFEPMMVLRNSMISSTAEVLETYIYQVGLVRARYGLGAAAGLFRATIGIALLLAANFLSKKLTDDGRTIL